MVAKHATKKNYIPNRGDFVWLDFHPTKGHEQQGLRPAIVISPLSYNTKSGLMLVCPVTSTVHGYPFEVDVKTSELSGAIISGVILVDRIRSVDWRDRHVRFIAKSRGGQMEEILEKLLVLVS